MVGYIIAFVIGLLAAFVLSRCFENDRYGTVARAERELAEARAAFDDERNIIEREREQLERERIALESERKLTLRNREISEELQRRASQGKD